MAIGIDSVETKMGPSAVDRDVVVREIYQAIGRINELRDPGDRIACSEETVLYGSGGALDSLGLVSLILDVEQAVNERAGTSLVLADEQAMSQRRNPFRDVRSLADYVMSRLGGRRMIEPPVILITGTRKGIGRHLATALTSSRGLRVVGCSRQPAELEADGYWHHCLDVGDEAAVRRLLAEVRERLGGLHALINNAGVAAMNHALLTPMETVRSVLETNVIGHVPVLPGGGQTVAVVAPRPDRERDVRRGPLAAGGRGDLRGVQGGRRDPDPRAGPRAGPAGDHLQRRGADADRDRPDPGRPPGQDRPAARGAGHPPARPAGGRRQRRSTSSSGPRATSSPDRSFTWEVSREPGLAAGADAVLGRPRGPGRRGGSASYAGLLARMGRWCEAWTPPVSGRAGSSRSTATTSDRTVALLLALIDTGQYRRARWPRPPRASGPSCWRSARAEFLIGAGDGAGEVVAPAASGPGTRSWTAWPRPAARA